MRTLIGTVFAIIVLLIFVGVLGHFMFGWNVPIISSFLGGG
jgi:hypothetical protein